MGNEPPPTEDPPPIEHTTDQPDGVQTSMGSRLEYLVRSKNRVVVHFNADTAGGGATFGMDPTIFGPTAWGEYTTTGLTYNSAAISRIVWGTGGVTGTVDLVFLGATGFTAYNIPAGGAGDLNLERMTIPNLAAGATGLFAIQNNLAGAAAKNATVMLEFVTRNV